jgi:glycine cleavage system H protein
VIAVNEALEDTPQLINQDPYGEGWIFRLRTQEGLDKLLDAVAYAKLEAVEE